MSAVDKERLKRLVVEASGIVAAANGKVKIKQAMALVGFTTTELANMTFYQQVRRRSAKLTLVEIGKAPVPHVEFVTGWASVDSKTSSITRARSTCFRGSAAAVVTVAAAAPVAAAAAVPVAAAAIMPVTTTVHGSSARHLITCTSSSNKSSEKKQKDKVKEDKKKTVAAKVPRRSPKDVQRENANAIMLAKRNEQAMKQATAMIERSKALPRSHPEKKSIAAIVEEANARFNSNISASSAARYVRAGMIGISPRKRGPIGDFTPTIYNALKGAFVTFLKLEQANCGKNPNIPELTKIVNNCVNKAGFNRTRDGLTRKLIKDTAELGKTKVMIWTSTYTLDAWFTTWKDTLIDLGFGSAKVVGEEFEGEVMFFQGMTDRIGSIDETDVSLDGNTGPISLSPLDAVGEANAAVSKSGYLATVICGSTASGDPFPVHFQLKTVTQTDEGQSMAVDWLSHTKEVIGKFGYPTKRPFPCTFDMNERAGMNPVELEKYIKNSILPLYPDIEDKPGKRVLLKVDSGPGRLTGEMLADFKRQGLYLFPGIPDTNHKTQEIDQNYGICKSSFRENLKNLSQSRFEFQLTQQVGDLPLLVFGGECPSTGLKLRDAFSNAFSVDRNLSCWKKCGAVPLTRAPLQSGAIMHDVPVVGGGVAVAGGEEECLRVMQLRSLEALNQFYCDILTSNGCDGSTLSNRVRNRPTHIVAVTQPQSME